MEKDALNKKLLETQSLEYYFKSQLLDVNDTDYILNMQSTIDMLFSKGWTKKKMYFICMYINHFLDLEEIEYDVVGNFIDCLTGFCISPYKFLLDRENVLETVNVNPLSHKDIKKWIMDEIEKMGY
jgi:hypothetical protein